MRGVAEAMHPIIDRLDKRVAELEARPTLRNLGVWKSDVSYGIGAAVTHQGSIWISRAVTLPGDRPGDSGDAWQLAVKRERGARDDD
jgi:hypothetical protein